MQDYTARILKNESSAPWLAEPKACDAASSDPWSQSGTSMTEANLKIAEAVSLRAPCFRAGPLSTFAAFNNFLGAEVLSCEGKILRASECVSGAGMSLFELPAIIAFARSRLVCFESRHPSTGWRVAKTYRSLNAAPRGTVESGGCFIFEPNRKPANDAQ